MAFHLRAARRYPPDGQHSFPCDIYPHHNPPSLHLQPRAARFQDCEGGRESATRLHECPYSVPDAPPCPETGQDGVPETFLAFPRQSPTSGWRQARRIMNHRAFQHFPCQFATRLQLLQHFACDGRQVLNRTTCRWIPFETHYRQKRRLDTLHWTFTKFDFQCDISPLVL